MRLPRQVDPHKLSVQEAHLQGEVPTAGMERLAGAVMGQNESAAVDLVFRRDEMNRCIVEGKVSLAVTMRCQRCLGEVEEQLESDMIFGVVREDDRAAALPKWLDPWLVAGDDADLYELIEDELLLALPIVAFHDEENCPGRGHYSTGEVEEARDNPFSVLKALKK